MIKCNRFFFIIILFFFGCTDSEKSFLDLDRLSLIDKVINKEIENQNLPGAVVLVGNKKDIIFQKAYGIKNPETNEKYRVDDIFRIASMTKAITSLAIIKLWENGKRWDIFSFTNFRHWEHSFSHFLLIPR